MDIVDKISINSLRVGLIDHAVDASSVTKVSDVYVGLIYVDDDIPILAIYNGSNDGLQVLDAGTFESIFSVTRNRKVGAVTIRDYGDVKLSSCVAAATKIYKLFNNPPK